MFDRELRSILLKYILIFERDFKTTIAYNFSKKYNKDNRIDSYLYPENYKDNYVEVLNFISSINNIIVSKSEKSNYIRHYIENYGHIPLWVAVNIMSFGNMSFMFKILKDEDRNQIILFYVMRFLNQNNKKVIPTKFRSETFLSGLKILNLARNICAHEERMYNAQFDRVKTKDISKLLEYSDYDGSKLISVVLFLKVVLIEKSFALLKKDLLEIFTKFQNRFKTIKFGDILKEMGIKLESFYQL
nr:Abi family protein [Mycoplasma mycoides]